jgi:hypothetical protein
VPIFKQRVHAFLHVRGSVTLLSGNPKGLGIGFSRTAQFDRENNPELAIYGGREDSDPTWRGTTRISSEGLHGLFGGKGLFEGEYLDDPVAAFRRNLSPTPSLVSRRRIAILLLGFAALAGLAGCDISSPQGESESPPTLVPDTHTALKVLPKQFPLTERARQEVRGHVSNIPGRKSLLLIVRDTGTPADQAYELQKRLLSRGWRVKAAEPTSIQFVGFGWTGTARFEEIPEGTSGSIELRREDRRR